MHIICFQVNNCWSFMISHLCIELMLIQLCGLTPLKMYITAVDRQKQNMGHLIAKLCSQILCNIMPCNNKYTLEYKISYLKRTKNSFGSNYTCFASFNIRCLIVKTNNFTLLTSGFFSVFFLFTYQIITWNAVIFIVPQKGLQQTLNLLRVCIIVSFENPKKVSRPLHKVAVTPSGNIANCYGHVFRLIKTLLNVQDTSTRNNWCLTTELNFSVRN